MSLLVKGEVSPPIASKPFAEVKASCTILGREFLRVSMQQAELTVENPRLNVHNFNMSGIGLTCLLYWF